MRLLVVWLPLQPRTCGFERSALLTSTHHLPLYSVISHWAIQAVVWLPPAGESEVDLAALGEESSHSVLNHQRSNTNPSCLPARRRYSIQDNRVSVYRFHCVRCRHQLQSRSAISPPISVASLKLIRPAAPYVYARRSRRTVLPLPPMLLNPIPCVRFSSHLVPQLPSSIPRRKHAREGKLVIRTTGLYAKELAHCPEHTRVSCHTPLRRLVLRSAENVSLHM